MKKITSPARREFSFPVPIDLQRDGGDKQNSDENDNGPPALHIVNLIADRECSKWTSKTKDGPAIASAVPAEIANQPDDECAEDSAHYSNPICSCYSAPWCRAGGFEVAALPLLILGGHPLIERLIQTCLCAFGQKPSRSHERFVHTTGHHKQFAVHQSFVSRLRHILGRGHTSLLECARVLKVGFRKEIGVGRTRTQRSDRDAAVTVL